MKKRYRSGISDSIGLGSNPPFEPVKCCGCYCHSNEYADICSELFEAQDMLTKLYFKMLISFGNALRSESKVKKANVAKDVIGKKGTGDFTRDKQKFSSKMNSMKMDKFKDCDNVSDEYNK